MPVGPLRTARDTWGRSVVWLGLGVTSGEVEGVTSTVSEGEGEREGEGEPEAWVF